MKLIQLAVFPPVQSGPRTNGKKQVCTKKRLGAAGSVRTPGAGRIEAVQSLKHKIWPRPLPGPPVVVTPWVRIPQPNGEFVLRPGKPLIEEDEIGTCEAAKLLGLSRRRINSMCDEGILVEGRDWWRTSGSKRGGDYHIQRAAVLRLKYGG